jgi:hypothetical protein
MEWFYLALDKIQSQKEARKFAYFVICFPQLILLMIRPENMYSDQSETEIKKIWTEIPKCQIKISDISRSFETQPLGALSLWPYVANYLQPRHQSWTKRPIFFGEGIEASYTHANRQHHAAREST